MKKDMLRLEVARSSAVLIQRSWRGYAARRRFAAHVNNIITVQTQVGKGGKGKSSVGRETLLKLNIN